MFDEIENKANLKNNRNPSGHNRNRNILEPLVLVDWDLPLSKVPGSILRQMLLYSPLDIDYEVGSNYQSPEGERENNIFSTNAKNVRVSTMPYYLRRLTLAYPSFLPEMLFPVDDYSKKTTSAIATNTTTLLSSSPTEIKATSSSEPSSKKEENDHHNKNINMHTDYFANKLSRLYNADAVTIGRNIFFSSGKMELSSPKGLALFAHELVHIKQQASDPSIISNDNIGDSRRATLESEAKEIERRVLDYFDNKYSTFYSKRNQDRELLASAELNQMSRFLPRHGFMTAHPFLPSESLRILSHHNWTSYQNLSGKGITFRTYEDLASPTIAEKENSQTTIFNMTPTNNAATNQSGSRDILNNFLAASKGASKQIGPKDLTFLSPSPLSSIQQQQTGSENRPSPIPFTAESGRSVESEAIAPTSASYLTNTVASSTSEQIAAGLQEYLMLNGNLLAERVLGIIQDKIKMQRNVIGFR